MDSLISVIVPVYNVEKYLNRCVESIINQTYKNLEIILVDDGSPDNCPQICNEWAKKDKRVIVIHKENGGVSSARNAGLDIAKGGYITFVDSDDWIHSQMIEILFKDICSTGADIAICGYKRVEKEEKETKIDYKTERVKCYRKIEAFSDVVNYNVYKNVYWSVCLKLYKKELFLNLRFFNRKNAEDLEMIYHILDRCKKICRNKYELYYYFSKNEASATHNNNGLDDFFVIKDMFEYFKEKKYTELYNKTYLYLLYMFFWRYFYIHVCVENNKILKEILLKKMEEVNANINFQVKLTIELKINSLLFKLNPKLFIVYYRIYNLFSRGLKRILNKSV